MHQFPANRVLHPAHLRAYLPHIQSLSCSVVALQLRHLGRFENESQLLTQFLNEFFHPEFGLSPRYHFGWNAAQPIPRRSFEVVKVVLEKRGT